jgi:hypothetical protein
MKINIHIEDATPAVLSAISSIVGVKTTLYTVKKKAPYGLKKDGTPAKKRGRPAGVNLKKEEAK